MGCSPSSFIWNGGELNTTVDLSFDDKSVKFWHINIVTTDPSKDDISSVQFNSHFVCYLYVAICAANENQFYWVDSLCKYYNYNYKKLQCDFMYKRLICTWLVWVLKDVR